MRNLAASTIALGIFFLMVINSLAEDFEAYGPRDEFGAPYNIGTAAAYLAEFDASLASCGNLTSMQRMLLNAAGRKLTDLTEGRPSLHRIAMLAHYEKIFAEYSETILDETAIDASKTTCEAAVTAALEIHNAYDVEQTLVEIEPGPEAAGYLMAHWEIARTFCPKMGYDLVADYRELQHMLLGGMDVDETILMIDTYHIAREEVLEWPEGTDAAFAKEQYCRTAQNIEILHGGLY
ncbi:hypothetical protein [Roseibium sp.]|uniref:hypothetical protein n=1 Tax=Roseibium sp. TaxID=1936156 RepID=UPI003B501EF3